MCYIFGRYFIGLIGWKPSYTERFCEKKSRKNGKTQWYRDHATSQFFVFHVFGFSGNKNYWSPLGPTGTNNFSVFRVFGKQKPKTTKKWTDFIGHKGSVRTEFDFLKNAKNENRKRCDVTRMEPSANQIPGFIVFVFSVFQNPVYRTAL